MIPNYTAQWDRGDIYRGDTLDGFSILLKEQLSGITIIPAFICAHIVDAFGRKVVELESVIGVNGRVTFARVDGSITSKWRAGQYGFDVEYTAPDGRVRTYLTVSFTVIEDKSKCLAP